MKKFNLNFWGIVLIEGIMVFGYSVSFPFLALYLNTRNYDITSIGFYFSVVMLVSSFTNSVGGNLSDFIGRKKIVFYSLFLRGFFTGLIALVVLWNLNPGYILFLNLLSSISSLGFHSVVVAYISDIVEEKDRVEAFSILRIATNAGWAVGPAVGGFLSDIGYSVTFSVSCFIFLLLSAYVAWWLDDSKSANIDEEHSFNFSFKINYSFTKEFVLILVYSFLMTAVMSHLVVPLSLYSKKYLGFSEKEIGFLFTINGVIVIFVQYFIGKLIKNHKIYSYLFISCILYGIGYLIYGYSGSYLMAVFSIVIVTCGEVIFSPSITACVSNMVPPSKRGSYIGFHGMVSEFGRAFGIFIGNFLIDNISVYFKQAPWFGVLLFSVVSAFGFKKLEGKKNNPSSAFKQKRGL